jgi:hypothetical protein
MERDAVQEAGAADTEGDGTELRMDVEYVRSYAAATTGNLMAVPGAGAVLLAHWPLLSALLTAALPAADESHGAYGAVCARERARGQPRAAGRASSGRRDCRIQQAAARAAHLDMQSVCERWQGLRGEMLHAEFFGDGNERDVLGPRAGWGCTHKSHRSYVRLHSLSKH